MTTEERLCKLGKKTLAALGLFFGLGFTIGFLTGFGYGYANRPVPSSQATSQSGDVTERLPDEIAPVQAVSSDVASRDAAASDDEYGGEDDLSEAPIDDGEFALTEHELGDDENGLFISGTVVNRSRNAFDAVQVAFELCDANGKPYTTVADRTTERMEPGDSWGFVVYIPYSEMTLFDSYRLQGIMGVRK